MIVIECPYCGPRQETEYHYGGQAHVAYPEDPSALTDEQWAHDLFYRDNPRGPMAERWVHSGGCRKWFNVVRDTLTYEISHVYESGQPCPDPSVLRRPGTVGPGPGDPTFEDGALAAANAAQPTSTPADPTSAPTSTTSQEGSR